MAVVLLVEDNYNIAEGLSYSFEKEGYTFIIKGNIADAGIYLDGHMPDLVLLDVALPDGNGFELYSHHIKAKKIPTIFLTAKDEENDIVRGLCMGAEDYITKPFSTRELLARAAVVLRRYQAKSTITVADLTYDLDKMCLMRQGKIVSLSSLELKIVHLLFLNADKVVKREQIINLIWEATGNDVYDHTVTVYMKRIREKLQTDIITTIKGIGYRIDTHE